jgi:hypothetical protein
MVIVQFSMRCISNELVSEENLINPHIPKSTHNKMARGQQKIQSQQKAQEKQVHKHAQESFVRFGAFLTPGFGIRDLEWKKSRSRIRDEHAGHDPGWKK